MKRTIALLFSLVFLLFLTAGCGSRSYDAKELARIGVTGADGYGLLSLAIDDVHLKELLEAEGEKIREGDSKRLEALIQREAALNSLIYTADKISGLKNGDEIRITVNFDEGLAKSAGVRLKNTKFSYRVSGLVDAAVIDVEKDVELVFNGYDGDGEASLLLGGETGIYRAGFDFSFPEGNTKLKNGDRIRLQVKADNAYLTSRGKIARDRVLIFDVQGLAPLVPTDLFANLVLVYDGISGQGLVSLDVSRLPAGWVEAVGSGSPPVRFLAEPADSLSNGDRVTVRVLADEDFLAERGLRALAGEKTYTVSGLKEYPRHLDDTDLLPLFSRIDSFLRQDLSLRLDRNYWNRDQRTGEPVSLWDYRFEGGILRIYYGYEEQNRADNFLALFYKISIDGTCLEADPYESVYAPGDLVSSSLYLVYIVEDIMYDRPLPEDFRAIGLKLHGDVELDLVSRFKNQFGGEGVRIVEVPVPEQAPAISGEARLP